MTETEEIEEEEDEDEVEEEEEVGIEGSEDESVEYDEQEEWHGVEQDMQGDELEDVPAAAAEIPQESLSQPGEYPYCGISENNDILPVTKYVPPHLRNMASMGSSEALLKLTKQLKGLLNRMSEQNIGSILDNIEELFRNNRRHGTLHIPYTLLRDSLSPATLRRYIDPYLLDHRRYKFSFIFVRLICCPACGIHLELTQDSRY